ncbi:MFS transporter [Calycomorphotria hydatis]|uniref:Major facilitator superfamily transporter n=1 Tax=Calycomorphotria hydatis TaxID=2528027 RepID=A0A517TD26_9PLAN|nr:MFS transporter [Calycomorphotria hydatis]QDT66274.1 major facilitator superfamily transporter [Calycomorphotria hydatis]
MQNYSSGDPRLQSGNHKLFAPRTSLHDCRMTTASRQIDFEKIQEPSIYTPVFWTAYAGHLTVVTANAVTFRFAELVTYLGGSDQTSGEIVSVGVLAGLIARWFLGQAIDRFGLGKVWIATTISLFAGAILLMFCRDLGVQMYLARILFAIGLAGAFTGSNVHIQKHVPPHRRTEAIGALGTSGFIALIVGTTLGDLIFNFQGYDAATRFTLLFGATAAFSGIYLMIVGWLSWHDEHEAPAATLPAHKLLFRYQPLAITLVATMLGMTFAVTTVFLTRIATHLHLAGIGPFFAGYAVSAFVFRIITRRWSQQVGRHKLILIGLAGYALGHSSMILVTNEWMFLIPAAFMGFGHALLFPCVVSLISEAYPLEFRGTGTSMALGFIEVGTLIFAPLLGFIIDWFDGTGYTQALMVAAGMSVISGVVYAIHTAGHEDMDIVLSRQFQQAYREANSRVKSEPVPEDLSGAGAILAEPCTEAAVGCAE